LRSHDPRVRRRDLARQAGARLDRHAHRARGTRSRRACSSDRLRIFAAVTTRAGSTRLRYARARSCLVTTYRAISASVVASPIRFRALRSFDIVMGSVHLAVVDLVCASLTPEQLAWLEHDQALRLRAREIAARSGRDPEDIYKTLRHMERSPT